jgi:hypothetical protein
VTIPLIQQLVKDGVFDASEKHAGAIKPMLDELRRWSDALTVLRS